MPHGYYDYALDLILDEDVQQDDGMTEEQHEVVAAEAARARSGWARRATRG